MTNPRNNTMRLERDTKGNVVQQINAYHYDRKDRLTTDIINTNPAISFTYDGNDNRSSQIDTILNTQLTYLQGSNRVLQTTAFI
ncbi:MAG: hypothetical protein HAW67_07655 [Endozoicomonadaceae bacterium]|nr:hypothetical protein [Endozoicomonadaceae bacterium]